MRNPSSGPGPRNDRRLERFALSKEALKTRGRAWLKARSCSRSAASSVARSFSITFKPAINTRGAPSPTGTGPILIQVLLRRDDHGQIKRIVDDRGGSGDFTPGR